jgi:hypothetical protein
MNFQINSPEGTFVQNDRIVLRHNFGNCHFYAVDPIQPLEKFKKGQKDGIAKRPPLDYFTLVNGLTFTALVV